MALSLKLRARDLGTTHYTTHCPFDETDIDGNCANVWCRTLFDLRRVLKAAAENRVFEFIEQSRLAARALVEFTCHFSDLKFIQGGANRAEAKFVGLAEASQNIARACIRHFRLNEPLLIARRSAEPLHQARVAIRPTERLPNSSAMVSKSEPQAV